MSGVDILLTGIMEINVICWFFHCVFWLMASMVVDRRSEEFPLCKVRFILISMRLAGLVSFHCYILLLYRWFINFVIRIVYWACSFSLLYPFVGVVQLFWHPYFLLEMLPFTNISFCWSSSPFTLDGLDRRYGGDGQADE